MRQNGHHWQWLELFDYFGICQNNSSTNYYDLKKYIFLKKIELAQKAEFFRTQQ